MISAACSSARALRAKAEELARGGHDILALAKLGEANTTCPAGEGESMALEVDLLASTGDCARATALAAKIAPSDAGAQRAMATCATRLAASKGTSASMRGKMREAYMAERAKDFARAKTSYLDAWTELHPNAVALENAARMAALAGDPVESRRVRDRALLEAEASEHETARVTSRVRVVRGAPRLFGNTLVLANEGKVVARDTTTGELRVLLDVPGARTTLSPSAMLAFVSTDLGSRGSLTVYDVPTGAALFKVDRAKEWTTSPDDSTVAVMSLPDDGGARSVRVFEAQTGAARATLNGKWASFFLPTKCCSGSDGLFFVRDSAHLFVFGTEERKFCEWDLDKQAMTGSCLVTPRMVAATSADGRFLAYVGDRTKCNREDVDEGDCALLHVRELATSKDTQWLVRFFPIVTIGVSPDGETVATGSEGSLRLFDVKTHKQTFVKGAHYGSRGTLDASDPNEFTFSDDGKTVVFAGGELATAWNVATGAEAQLVTEQPFSKVLRVIVAPDAQSAAIVLEDAVRIVTATGQLHTVCQGTQPIYKAMIGPTNAAFSPSGKSFACSMMDGVLHVLDTASWTRRGTTKTAVSTADRPVDLAFADDQSLAVISDTTVIVYNAQTATETSRVAFKHPSKPLTPRHFRLGDGTIAVRTWDGSAAIFAADGAYQRDMKLFIIAPVNALDALAANGNTYVVARDKALEIADLTSGEKRTVTLPSTAKTLAVSDDGKTIAVLGKDGALSTVTGDAVHPVGHASQDGRVWFAGGALAWLSAPDTIELHPTTGDLSLEIVPQGFVARDASGAFEVGGKPELECVAGKTYLTRETCADRAKEGLAGQWLRAAR